MKYISFVILFSLGCINIIKAQIDSIDFQDNVSQSVIEDFIENQETEDFDYNTISAHLESYLSKPLNLNKATETDLAELGILSNIQILNFLNYKKTAGELISIYELQAIPGFDQNSIQKILPFVTCESKLQDFQLSLPKMIQEGSNQLFFRWSRTLQTAQGYQKELPSSGFLGDPNRYYLRFRHKNSNKLSYGFTAEKDPGEEFFTGSNKQGFDFYSAHFFLKDFTHKLKAIALGDYNISFGQGLILRTGFSPGKSALTMNIKRIGAALRGFTSANEFDFMRGAAIQYQLTKNWEVLGFASFRNLDANILLQEDIESEIADFNFSSFQKSGLHRTISEIEDEKSLRQNAFGGRVSRKFDFGTIALNSVYYDLDKSLTSGTRLYNQYYFSGNRLLNLSLDYSILFRNLNLFGETAYSDNGSIATLNGLLLAIDRKVSFSFLFRHFPRDFHTLNGQPFSEKRGARNESGLYIGTEIQPKINWKINAYIDLWKHPWLNFSSDFPASGYEWLARITYSKRRKFITYLQFRNEIKGQNLSGNVSKADEATITQRFQTRLHFSYNVSKSIELRSRIDGGSFKEGTEDVQTGFSMYQDVIFKPKGIPFSLKTRFAIFDTESYDVRYYHYENDVLYTFSIPAYYHEGTRFYINLRYTGIRKLLLEARYAQTYWNNQDSFGSGNDEIVGKRRSQIKMQLSYKF